MAFVFLRCSLWYWYSALHVQATVLLDLSLLMQIRELVIFIFMCI
jgi:hypothetical protein